jgi:neutral ceramidase
MFARCRSRLAALVLVTVGALGCSSVSGTLPAPAPGARAPSFRAGAARVDLTPPPGQPMGGFSGIGKISRGYWTRLHARAVHLQAPDGEALVFVSCDLWSMAAGLADRVAELAGDDPRTRHIGRHQLVLAATHTHHSPGNFSTSPAFNALASPQPGFDRALFEHFARSIQRAIATACERSEPATVRFASTVVPRLARNRSFEAFQQDPEHAAFLAANAGLPVGAPTDLYPDPDCYRAVDPSVSVLRIDPVDETGPPIAVLAFAALHPTVLGPGAPVYSSDVFGVAALALEQGWGRSEATGEPETVVALFNGAEGDVSAAWESQGRRDTIRLGRKLAEGVRTAWEQAADEPAQSPALDHRYAVVPVSARTFIHAGKAVRTASVPAIGDPALGGAEDGRTPEHADGHVEGVTGVGPAGHGVKRPAFDLQLPRSINPFPVTHLVHWLLPPPDEVPLGVYRVGGVTLATIPGEATTVIGHRVRRRLGSPTVIVGLAHEYLSYFATPEEYALQHYEGASTLWGTYSGALLVHELGRMADAPADGYEYTPALPRPFAFDTGFERTFGMGRVVPVDDPLEGLESLLGRETDFPGVSWQDDVPDLRGSTPFLTPLVGIERSDGRAGWEPLRIGGVPEDDDGFRIITVVTDVGGGRSAWHAYWTPPPGLAVRAPLLSRVRRCDGSVVHSQPFRVGAYGDVRPVTPDLEWDEVPAVPSPCAPPQPSSRRP